MKTMTRKFWMASIMLVALFGFTSCECDPDESLGFDVSGHWFGDLDMYYGNEKARGSEIEFRPIGWGYTRGTGVEVDYYWGGTITHRFDYEVINRVIYMYFDDRALDCAISDYSISPYYFTGYMDGAYESARFRLRSYDRYWNLYGYGDYYYTKQNKMDDAWNDSISSDTTRAVPAGNISEAPKCYRGVNVKKGLEIRD